MRRAHLKKKKKTCRINRSSRFGEKGYKMERPSATTDPKPKPNAYTIYPELCPGISGSAFTHKPFPSFKAKLSSISWSFSGIVRSTHQTGKSGQACLVCSHRPKSCFLRRAMRQQGPSHDKKAEQAKVRSKLPGIQINWGLEGSLHDVIGAVMRNSHKGLLE